jgi:hypothetical protein
MKADIIIPEVENNIRSRSPRVEDDFMEKVWYAHLEVKNFFMESA